MGRRGQIGWYYLVAHLVGIVGDPLLYNHHCCRFLIKPHSHESTSFKSYRERRFQHEKELNISSTVQKSQPFISLAASAYTFENETNILQYIKCVA